MNESFYLGSYKDDAKKKPYTGWIVGTFMEPGPRQSDDIEVKYWSYQKGDNKAHDTKISSIIECTFILTGSVKGMIDGQEATFNAGDYVVIQPGTPNNMIIDVLEDTTGLTIKAPSDPTAKKVIS